MSRAYYRKTDERADEQSMDEILASIRRIIDEEPLGARSTPLVTGPRVSADPSSLALYGIRKTSGPMDGGNGARPVKTPRRYTPDDDLALLLEPEGLSDRRDAPRSVIGVSSFAAAPAVIVDGAPTDAPVPFEISVDVVKPGVSLEFEARPADASPPSVVSGGMGADEVSLSADYLLSTLAADLDKAVAAMAAALDASPVAECGAVGADLTLAVSVAAALIQSESPTAPLVDAALLTSPQAAAAAAVAAVVAANSGVTAVPVDVVGRDGGEGTGCEPMAPEGHAQTIGTGQGAVEVGVEVDGADENPQPAAMENVAVAVKSLNLLADGPYAAVAQVADAAGPQVSQLPAAFDDAIANMLRPLLRDWLDANLPRMVEKALKDELVDAGGLLVKSKADAT
jgi:uncharacterized protein